ncbi:site-specific DNA-methyltransferase [bacterium]|nr:site-specific DNA-methyltransferase [bacterium]
MINEFLNKIIHGDCFEVLKQIPENSVDLVLTDPPYLYRNIKAGGSSQLTRTMQNAFNELSEIRDGVSLDFCKEILRIQEKVNCYIWCSKDQIIDYLDFFVTQNGCSFDVLWWYKTNAMPTFNNKYLTDKEYCLYFRRGGYCMPANYEKAKTLFIEPINIKDKKLYKHPTIKPLKIFETLIENSTKEGDVVLDCFSGSGTTAIACHNLKRKYICIEKDKTFYDISCDRLYNATCQGSLF